jgi:hypothetical protein
MSETLFTFEAWRGYLAFDAAQVGIHETVQVMSDAMLESFWRAGIQPTTRAVLDYCESATSPSEECPPKKPARRLRSHEARSGSQPGFGR